MSSIFNLYFVKKLTNAVLQKQITKANIKQ